MIVYHGTSSIHLDSILREGLHPPAYFTPLLKIAELEAMYTVIGDPCDGLPFFLSRGEGGRDVVLVINADDLWQDAVLEDDEYEPCVAYYSNILIPPESIIGVISWD